MPFPPLPSPPVDASSTLRGVVNTGTQSFSGSKSFLTKVLVGTNTDDGNGILQVNGNLNLTGTGNGTIRSATTDGASAVAFLLNTANSLQISGGKFLSIQNQGVEVFSLSSILGNTNQANINIAGSTHFFGANAVMFAGRYQSQGNQSLALQGTPPDGPSAIAFTMNSGTTLLTNGAKLISYQISNAEIASMDINGIYTGGLSAIGGASSTDVAVPINATHTTFSSGGVLVPGTYYYQVTATNANGETLASTETSIVVPAGTNTNTVTVKWGAVTGATGYKIYGRSSTLEQLIGSVAGGQTTSFVDTGSVSPSGTPPTYNTAGGFNGVQIAPMTATLSAPTGATVASGGVGTLTAGSYNYAISAIGQQGETTLSAVTTLFTATGSNQAHITWTAVTGAIGYNIYINGWAGTFSAVYLGTVSGQSNTSFNHNTQVPVTTFFSPPFNSTQGIYIRPQPVLGALTAGITLGRAVAVMADGRETGSANPAYFYYDGFKWIFNASEGINTPHIGISGAANQLTPNVADVRYKFGPNGNTGDFIASDGTSLYVGAPLYNFGVVNMAGYVGGGSLGAPTGLALSTATTGGSLAPGTYGYRISATNQAGESVACTEVTQVVPAGTSTNTVTLTWTALRGAVNYNIYGRTSGAELYIASVDANTLSFIDDGLITPAGALPAADRTGDDTGATVLQGFLSPPTIQQVGVQGVGSIAAGWTSYRVSALNANGETLASEAVSFKISSPSTMFIRWESVPGATSYKLYGRTPGAQQLIITITAGNPTYVVTGLGGPSVTYLYQDTGSVTPSGALPASNTAKVVPLAINQGNTQKVALDATGKINYPTGAADAIVGTATLSGGTVTVNTTSVTASSLIYFNHAGTGTVANFGTLYKGTVSAGTSFQIKSTNASDNDTVSWWIVN